MKKNIKNVKKSTKKMTLKENDTKNKIDFEFHNDLIYHRNRKRFCISFNFEKKNFELAYNSNQHFDAHRCFQRINNTLFILKLFKKIRIYINHCFDCQLD